MNLPERQLQPPHFRKVMPSTAEVDERKKELIDEFLEHPDNAHEAFSEEISSHANLWAPLHQAMADGDDAELGRKFRVVMQGYAERCIAERLMRWIEDYE